MMTSLALMHSVCQHSPFRQSLSLIGLRRGICMILSSIPAAAKVVDGDHIWECSDQDVKREARNHGALMHSTNWMSLVYEIRCLV